MWYFTPSSSHILCNIQTAQGRARCVCGGNPCTLLHPPPPPALQCRGSWHLHLQGWLNDSSASRPSNRHPVPSPSWLSSLLPLLPLHPPVLIRPGLGQSLSTMVDGQRGRVSRSWRQASVRWPEPSTATTSLLQRSLLGVVTRAKTSQGVTTGPCAVPALGCARTQERLSIWGEEGTSGSSHPSPSTGYKKWEAAKQGRALGQLPIPGAPWDTGEVEGKPRSFGNQVTQTARDPKQLKVKFCFLWFRNSYPTLSLHTGAGERVPRPQQTLSGLPSMPGSTAGTGWPF